ncbi:hypothetical protein [Streptomyces hirsutus]|uniref:hypothetical protein n=1 Tax=Streptomyces hirsutus TaxID=35620 RepID=UPI003319D598
MDGLHPTELGEQHRRGESDDDRRVGAADLPRGTEQHGRARAHHGVQHRREGIGDRVEVVPELRQLTYLRQGREAAGTPVRLPVEETDVEVQELAHGASRSSQQDERRHIHGFPR